MQKRASKFNSCATVTKLPEALVSFMLLANSNVDCNQRVSVLSATSSNISTTSSSSISDCLTAASYEKVASVVRQCDDISTKDFSSTIVENYANYSNNDNYRINDRSRSSQLSPEQLMDLKSICICFKCQKYGHWQSDHSDDGSLRPGLKATDEPPKKSEDPQISGIDRLCLLESYN